MNRPAADYLWRSPWPFSHLIRAMHPPSTPPRNNALPVQVPSTPASRIPTLNKAILQVSLARLLSCIDKAASHSSSVDELATELLDSETGNRDLQSLREQNDECNFTLGEASDICQQLIQRLSNTPDDIPEAQTAPPMPPASLRTSLAARFGAVSSDYTGVLYRCTQDPSDHTAAIHHDPIDYNRTWLNHTTVPPVGATPASSSSSVECVDSDDEVEEQELVGPESNIVRVYSMVIDDDHEFSAARLTK